MPVTCPECLFSHDPIMCGEGGLCINCRVNKNKALVAAGVNCPSCHTRPIATGFLCAWCNEQQTILMRMEFTRQEAIRVEADRAARKRQELIELAAEVRASGLPRGRKRIRLGQIKRKWYALTGERTLPS